MIFHIVILSFFRLPRGAQWYFFCAQTLCTSPSTYLSPRAFMADGDLFCVRGFDSHSLFVYKELNHTTLLDDYS